MLTGHVLLDALTMWKKFSVFTPDSVPYPQGSLIPGLGNGAESKEAV
jgi:hypothetical protein